jgi:hypothetical protein
MTVPVLVLALTLAASVPQAATPPSGTARAIDFDRFVEDALEARAAREGRLASLEEFLAMARDGDTVLLDTRSETSYRAMHLAGAVHLPFSDLTEASLRRVLGDRDRRVLIYCNNNFVDDVAPFPTKAPPAALNIPTFVALWSYGYRNVYELGELLELSDPRLRFAGALADRDAPAR